VMDHKMEAKDLSYIEGSCSSKDLGPKINWIRYFSLFLIPNSPTTKKE